MPENLQHLGKFLILAGVLIIAAGVVLMFWNKIPFIGKLPGDIFIKKENFTFYFPVVTCLLLSLLISLLLHIFKK
jgi:Protein of unknown function (DUF2905).